MKHFHPTGGPMKLRETDPLNNAEGFFNGIFFLLLKALKGKIQNF